MLYLPRLASLSTPSELCTTVLHLPPSSWCGWKSWHGAWWSKSSPARRNAFFPQLTSKSRQRYISPPSSSRNNRHWWNGSDNSRTCRRVSGNGPPKRTGKRPMISKPWRTSACSCSASNEFRQTVWLSRHDAARHGEIRNGTQCHEPSAPQPRRGGKISASPRDPPGFDGV